MLEHAKIFLSNWNTSSGKLKKMKSTGLTSYVGTCKDYLNNQKFSCEKSEHLTHMLGWNMQSLFEQSKHLFREIKGTRLTCYVGDCFSNQKISSEKSETLNSQPILEHAKVVWAIRTFLLRYELTSYVRMCKVCLSNQQICSEKWDTLDSQAMLEHEKVI